MIELSLERRELLDVLRQVRAALARPGNDFTWSSWEDAAAATMEVDAYITTLEAGWLPPRMELAVLFAPTGPIQEVSLQSGWSEEFLALSDRFDRAEEKVYEVRSR
ncbi:MAG TPA: hypothetical protein VLX92_18035 [Kofleriaceae bacterium]|nr:hypothetical protein [Kofleriaceae bacterium]